MSDIPECCIRGPDLDDHATIAGQIEDLSDAALAAYEAGIRDIRRVWNLGRLAAQVAHWQRERTFLVGQLRQLERKYPAEVARALAAGNRAGAEDGDTEAAGGVPCAS
jgi:hypothetical protein